MEAALHCLLMGLATAALSITLTKNIVGAPLRRFASYLGEVPTHLANCYYCMSHWIALGLATAYPIHPVPSSIWWLDIGLTAFAVVGIAALIAPLIILLGKRSQN